MHRHLACRISSENLCVVVADSWLSRYSGSLINFLDTILLLLDFVSLVASALLLLIVNRLTSDDSTNSADILVYMRTRPDSSGFFRLTFSLAILSYLLPFGRELTFYTKSQQMAPHTQLPEKRVRRAIQTCKMEQHLSEASVTEIEYRRLYHLNTVRRRIKESGGRHSPQLQRKDKKKMRSRSRSLPPAQFPSRCMWDGHEYDHEGDNRFSCECVDLKKLDPLTCSTNWETNICDICKEYQADSYGGICSVQPPPPQQDMALQNEDTEAWNGDLYFRGSGIPPGVSRYGHQYEHSESCIRCKAYPHDRQG